MQFRNKNVIKILECLCKNINSFSEIKKFVGLNDASIAHYLRRLICYDIIQKKGKGKYLLRRKTPLCYLFDDVDSFYYVGLLGKRDLHNEPEPETAILLLMQEGIRIDKRIIFTTPEALYSWSNFDFSQYNIKILNTRDLLDISLIEKRLYETIMPEMNNGLIILDCTSLTKTATIAVYNIAIKLNIPLIYVYEDKNKLVWLIDRS